MAVTGIDYQSDTAFFYFACSIGYVLVAVDIVWWIFSIHFPI